MPSSQSPSLIDEYSSVFTSLQAGKRQLIQWGADAVSLNRYIVDAASSTGVSDPSAVLQGIDLNKVTEGDTEEQRLGHCRNLLEQLVALQEESRVLQKSAREHGISAGLLTIVGQAASQSPNDNGASVLRQLGELVSDGQSNNSDQSELAVVQSSNAQSIEKPHTDNPQANSQPAAAKQSTAPLPIEIEEMAANDIDRMDSERLTALAQVAVTLREHWRALLVDAGVCVIATGIAISLVN